MTLLHLPYGPFTLWPPGPVGGFGDRLCRTNEILYVPGLWAGSRELRPWQCCTLPNVKSDETLFVRL